MVALSNMSKELCVNLYAAIMLFVLFAQVSFASNCSFEDEKQHYKIDRAPDDAKAAVASGMVVRFYAVATGFTPSRPGLFEHEITCLFVRYPWKILWTGADVKGACRDRKTIQAHALAYAEIYNTTLREELIRHGKYICGEAR